MPAKTSNSKYFGRPCYRCGRTERYLAKKECVFCTTKYNSAYYRKNRDKLVANQKDYADENREAINLRRKHSPSHKESQRRTNVKRYGITPERYDEMIVEQKGLCYICGLPPGLKRLYIDHCHTTRRVRRLLCHGCNAGLGFFRDDPKLLRLAADYLQETR